MHHEFSYDNFHANGERVYRLAKENTQNIYVGSGRFAVHPAPLYDVLANMSDVNDASRLGKWGNVVIESGDKTHYEDRYFAADSGLLKMLSFEQLAGNLEEALQRPRTAIISETTAIKLFGTTDAAGKTIKLTSFVDLGENTVDAVFKELPTNASLQFNIILRFLDVVMTTRPGDSQSWGNSNYNYLVMLNPGADPANLEAQLNEHLHKKYAGTDDESFAKITHYIAQPLPEVYGTHRQL